MGSMGPKGPAGIDGETGETGPTGGKGSIVSKIKTMCFAATVGPLHDPVKWYGINYAGTQITPWDFQRKELLPVKPDFPSFWKSHCVICIPHNLFRTLWPDRAKGLYQQQRNAMFPRRSGESPWNRRQRQTRLHKEVLVTLLFQPGIPSKIDAQLYLYGRLERVTKPLNQSDQRSCNEIIR